MSWGSPVAYLSLQKARKYEEEGQFGLASACYLFAYAVDGSCKIETKKDFLYVFYEWCKKLEEEKRYSELFQCYKEALTVLPDDVFILNNYGSHLLKCGFLEKAAFYFQECLTVAPKFLRAAHNLDDVLILQVERWHFKMLNDQNRNEAFRNAIAKKIRQGFDIVLDVGTGTGLFSLVCAEEKAKEIYACDVSPTMIKIAKNVFETNNVTDIKLIRKHSTSLQIPEDIDNKVSLLVTETFDVGLLGEHILPTLAHAWEHLLLPPQPQSEVLDPVKFGVVIPYKAVMYVTGIRFDRLANDFQLKETSNLNQDLFEGLNVLRPCDDYDSQDLSHAKFEFLTETKKMFDINFNDPDALSEFLKGWNKNMTLKCKSNGRLDCFAVWFDLHLDEDIVLNTSPMTKNNFAWDQAVFLLPRSVLVKEEQDLKITVSFDTSKLNITLSDNYINDPKFMASEDVIRMLNNEKLTKELQQVVNSLAPAYTDPVSILDCYPFPVFGLNFLRNRNDRSECELTCIVPTEKDLQLVNYMADKYGVNIDATVSKKSDFPADNILEKKFDIILLDLVELTGEIKDEILLLLDLLKSLLKPDGIILPKHVTVVGQFIYSDWLTKVSRVVDDSSTCGYIIAEHINEYKVPRFVDFDLKSIDSIPCSEPFELFDLLNDNASKIKMEVPHQSFTEFVNAFVYWLKIKFTDTSKEIITVNDTFYHQAAILYPKMKLVDPIKFKVVCDNGLFTVKLSNSFFSSLTTSN